ELEHARLDSVAAPPRVDRRLGRGELGCELSDALLELIAACDDLALRRGEGAELAPRCAAASVCDGVLDARAVDRTFNANLPPERVPVEQHSSPRVRGQFAALAA